MFRLNDFHTSKFDFGITQHLRPRGRPHDSGGLTGAAASPPDACHCSRSAFYHRPSSHWPILGTMLWPFFRLFGTIQRAARGSDDIMRTRYVRAAVTKKGPSSQNIFTSSSVFPGKKKKKVNNENHESSAVIRLTASI